MKKIKIILLATLILFAANSCKKDYPKDIPDWLKNEINFCGKKKNNCGKVADLIIDEYYYQGNIYYRFYIQYPPPRRNDYYDYNGNIICSNIWDPGCNYFSNGNKTFTRRIWKEKNN